MHRVILASLGGALLVACATSPRAVSPGARRAPAADTAGRDSTRDTVSTDTTRSRSDTTRDTTHHGQRGAMEPTVWRGWPAVVPAG
jgi:hypothetical protein